MAAIMLGLALVGTSACSKDDPIKQDGEIVRPGELSVFELDAGDCAVPPTPVQTEAAKIDVMPCTDPHTMETYELVPYKATGDGDTSANDFPGEAALKKFATAKCANAFEAYVGRPYIDSTLYFTYLTPSASAWSKNPGGKGRQVICLVTTSGKKLTETVEGSKL